MAAHAGETAQKAHVFHCARCGSTVSVRQGEVIPKCPNDHAEFKQRMQGRKKRS